MGLRLSGHKQQEGAAGCSLASTQQIRRGGIFTQKCYNNNKKKTFFKELRPSFQTSTAQVKDGEKTSRRQSWDREEVTAVPRQMIRCQMVDAGISPSSATS